MMLTRTRSLTGSQSSQEDSAPKEEYVPKKKARRKAPLRQTQWVCFMPDGVAPLGIPPEPTRDGPSFISFPDPRTGLPRKYLLSEDGTRICEVLKFSDEPRSWFIGNSVQTDGSLYMCTPLDPLFLAVPCLIRAAKSGKFTTLEAILEDGVYEYRVLEQCVRPEQWEHICDIKVLQSGMEVYRYNLERTLAWLGKKVEVLSKKLQEQGVYVGAGSCSSVLVRSNKQSNVHKEDYLHYACGVVSDYLPKELADELHRNYSFPDAAESQSRKLSREDTNADLEPPPKRPCLVEGGQEGEPSEDYTQFNSNSALPETTKPRKVSAAQKALNKVDKTGMISLTSFFGAKSTKRS